MNVSGRRGRDPMVVGFTTTCAISVYDHEFEPYTKKTERHDITEILLKVTLHTITDNHNHPICFIQCILYILFNCSSSN